LSNSLDYQPVDQRQRPAHAEAFRDPEGAVCDLDRMGEIACSLIWKYSEDSRELELAMFSVVRLCEMTRDFKATVDRRFAIRVFEDEPVDLPGEAFGVRSLPEDLDPEQFHGPLIGRCSADPVSQRKIPMILHEHGRLTAWCAILPPQSNIVTTRSSA